MESLTLILAGVGALIFYFLTKTYTYWKRKNVPGPIPIPILGNYKDYFTFKLTFGETLQKIYEKFPEEPFVGAYHATEPALIPRDPEMIKTIMTKDFYFFSGRMLVDHEFRDPLLFSNLFFASGDKWKVLRQNFNPMFSSAKLKNMLHLVLECGQKLETYLDLQYKQSDVQNIKNICINFTLEVIGCCFFGTKFETLTLNDNTIRNYAHMVTENSTLTAFKTNIHDTWPTLYYLFGDRAPGLEGDVGDFFFELAKKSFQSRDNKPIGRNDLTDFLLKFKEQGCVKGEGIRKGTEEGNFVKIETTEVMLASQIFIFFLGGFETSSSTLGFTFYELAKHPDIQQTLFEEIEFVLKKYNNEVSYDAIKEMKYMEMCTYETLRKYPLAGILTRECMKDYKFAEYDLEVEKGTRVQIPVWAIHYDSKYYPQPDKFDPERFSAEEVQKRPGYTFFGFGEGHRTCIGARFAMMQMAVGLIAVLRKYRMERCNRTSEKLHFDPRSGITTASGGMELRLVPRN